MNSKFYVSLEAARLLKEKGYNEETIYYYNSAGKLYLGNGHFNYNAYAVNLSAPSKSEAIDWLESKGVIVNTKYYSNRGNKRGQWSAQINRKDSWAYVALGEYYLTRLEAEEAAIIKALELL